MKSCLSRQLTLPSGKLALSPWLGLSEFNLFSVLTLVVAFWALPLSVQLCQQLLPVLSGFVCVPDD